MGVGDAERVRAVVAGREAEATAIGVGALAELDGVVVAGASVPIGDPLGDGVRLTIAM